MREDSMLIRSGRVLLGLAGIAYVLEGNTTMAALTVGLSLLAQIAYGNQVKKSTRPKSTRGRTAQRKKEPSKVLAVWESYERE
jgi:hypothetical protein